MSKLNTFLEEQKIDPRRLLAVSKRLEGLRPEDREIRLAKKRASGAAATEADKDKAVKKPRSGRPVSAPTLDAALKGRTISGAAKSRVLRAVNGVLGAKGRKPVQLSDVF